LADIKYRNDFKLVISNFDVRFRVLSNVILEKLVNILIDKYKNEILFIKKQFNFLEDIKITDYKSKFLELLESSENGEDIDSNLIK
jgi:hypothetical protein